MQTTLNIWTAIPAPFMITNWALHFWTSSRHFLEGCVALGTTLNTIFMAYPLIEVPVKFLFTRLGTVGSLLTFVTVLLFANLAIYIIGIVKIHLFIQNWCVITCRAKHVAVTFLSNHEVLLKLLVLFPAIIVLQNLFDLFLSWHNVASLLWTS